MEALKRSDCKYIFKLWEDLTSNVNNLQSLQHISNQHFFLFYFAHALKMIFFEKYQKINVHLYTSLILFMCIV